MRLFGKKPASADSENEGTEGTKTIVWGLRVVPSVRSRWKALAKLLGVPVNRLAAFVLADWFQRNRVLLESDIGRAALAKAITQAHREGKLD
jgi:hypothetical protein